MRTEIDIGQVFVDRCVEALDAGELTPEEAAEAKWWCTELQKRTVDRCVQLHGGYGYMLEYPIAPRLRRRPRHHDLRRDHRGDEGDHRAVDGREGPGVTAWRSASASRTPAGTRRPSFVREFCTTAEAGWASHSLWGVDHMVMPHHTDSLYTLGRKPANIGDDAVSGLLSPNYEMHTTLTWVAGFTERVKLGTAVAVLPIRNAVANARQVATLDVYSGGRVLYGVGAGWLREEAEAMGMPWDRARSPHRGAHRADACDLVRRGRPRRVPRRVPRLPPMDPEPRPVQRPSPILIGGHSDIALDRAGRIGDGWIAAMMSPPRLAEHWAKVREAAERNGRDPDRAAPGRVDAADCTGEELVDAVGERAELGVDHLTSGFRGTGPEEMLDEFRRPPRAGGRAPETRAVQCPPVDSAADQANRA